MRILVLCGFLLCVACSSQPLILDTTNEALAPVHLDKIGPYYVQVPTDYDVVFSGQRTPDTGKNLTGAMIYPVYGAGSAIAAVLAHAVVASSRTESREQKSIDLANKIIEPYQNLIDQITPDFFSNSTFIAALSEASEPIHVASTGGSDSVNSELKGWELELAPVFILSKSADSLTVVNKVTIINPYVKNDAGKSNFKREQTIIYQSSGIDEVELWLKDDGRLFYQAVGELVIESTVLALREFSSDFEPASEGMVTIRYLQNGKKKVERGKLRFRDCHRVVFESLRGELKAMPVLPGQCG